MPHGRLIYLQWELGNYCQSFIRMLGLQINSATEMYATLSNGGAFSDPNVGLYCLLLTTKNSMRNAVGERNTAILSRWAVFMTATALKRCGLPVSLHIFFCSCNYVGLDLLD